MNRATTRSASLLLALTLALAGATLVSGCGGDEAGAGSASGPTVVATTTQVADFVRNVGGRRIDVHQILQPNADPHEYEPRPSDVKSVAGAALAVRSGGRRRRLAPGRARQRRW